MKKRVTLEYLLDIFRKAGQTDQIREWEERVTAQVEERAAAEREQLRQENEQRRQEIERLRREIAQLRAASIA